MAGLTADATCASVSAERGPSAAPWGREGSNSPGFVLRPSLTLRAPQGSPPSSSLTPPRHHLTTRTVCPPGYARHAPKHLPRYRPCWIGRALDGEGGDPDVDERSWLARPTGSNRPTRQRVARHGASLRREGAIRRAPCGARSGSGGRSTKPAGSPLPAPWRVALGQT